MKPGALWPLAIVGVLAVTVGANIAMVVAARDPNAYVVEPDYYRKAVAWDSTMAEARRSAALGWSADVAFGRWEAAATPLHVRLADSTGAPVAGADVRVELVNNLAPELPLRIVLADAGAGRYEARPRLQRPGMWEVRLRAVRGADRFVTELRRDALAGPRP